MTARYTRGDVPPYSLGLCSPTTQLLPQRFPMAAAPHLGFDGAYFVKKIIFTEIPNLGAGSSQGVTFFKRRHRDIQHPLCAVWLLSCCRSSC